MLLSITAHPASALLLLDQSSVLLRRLELTHSPEHLRRVASARRIELT